MIIPIYWIIVNPDLVKEKVYYAIMLLINVIPFILLLVLLLLFEIINISDIPYLFILTCMLSTWTYRQPNNTNVITNWAAFVRKSTRKIWIQIACWNLSTCISVLLLLTNAVYKKQKQIQKALVENKDRL